MSSDSKIVGPHLEPVEGVTRAIVALSLTAQGLAVEGVDGFALYAALKGLTIAIAETVQEREPYLLPILDTFAYEKVLPHARKAIRVVKPGDSLPDLNR